MSALCGLECLFAREVGTVGCGPDEVKERLHISGV